MLSAFGGWLATQAGSLLLGFASDVIVGLYKSYAANQAQRERGRLESEAAQAREGARVEGELADQAGKRVSDDDALERLGKGDA